MHLPFIAHTRAHQMYVIIICTRLKCVFRFISCQIILITVQHNGNGCESTLKDELPQPRESLANNTPLCAYIYMYVCLYVCMQICMHVCTYVCTYAHMCVWVLLAKPHFFLFWTKRRKQGPVNYQFGTENH